MRDPSRLESDGRTAVAENLAVKGEKSYGNVRDGIKNSERRSRTGFNKRLLKNRRGEEQCFEEARASTFSYSLIIGPSMNFNLLRVSKSDQSSLMDLDGDGECSGDISMTDSTFGSAQYSTASRQQPFKKLERSGSSAEGKRLFHPENSFEAGLNQTAISSASSTLNEIDAVGVPGKKEEETINTKFAMRELSMMFSSPAFGVESVRKRHDRSRTSIINESAVEHQEGASFGDLGDGLGNVMLDNSVCGPPQGKQNTEFTIHEDISMDDNEMDDNQKPQATAKGIEFSLYEDECNQSHEVGSSVKVDENEIMEGSPASNTSDHLLENGDTANLSDAIALLDDDQQKTARSSPPEERARNSPASSDDHADTATISLFNEVFKDDNSEMAFARNKQTSTSSGFEIYIDDNVGNTDSTCVS